MIMSARFDPHIETSIQDEIFNTDIPAVVMGKVSKSGDISFYSNGPSRWDRDDSITPQHIFSIASMTKVLTSVAALQLVEQKQVT